MTTPAFVVKPEIMQRIIDQRLNFFEAQIGETQLNITILTRAIEVYNDPQDIAALANEQLKLDKMVLNYATVETVVVE